MSAFITPRLGKEHVLEGMRNFDWGSIFALFALFTVGGLIGVAEAHMSIRRSLWGGLRWLLVGFTVDGVVTLGAFWILRAALVADFWGEPLSIYMAALVWGPVLLRVKLELLVPLNSRMHDAIGGVVWLRQKLMDRVDGGAACYTSNWIHSAVRLAIKAEGYVSVAARASTYFLNLGHLSEEKRTNLVSQVVEIGADDISSEMRSSNLAQLLVDNGGKNFLKSLVGNRHQRRERILASARTASGVEQVVEMYGPVLVRRGTSDDRGNL